MITYVIHTYSKIDNKKIRYYITRFIKSGNFNTRYIEVEFCLYDENNNMTVIGKTHNLDTKDNNKIETYIFLIRQNLLTYEINNKINKVVFKYRELSRKEYLTRINK